ncbi:sulfatase-like hydrolase/transferase [Microlunatus soli]|uniref:Choline-sulfatase n=1 Tax=Microlunatus soli TaxID=630515 RepID=A0A1H1YJR5_9ACTN|nr:sulfatase-like hydrolase/transferase [Microlunatus soli]SDT21697.1 choline-sulfatase [Microlunatus soli]
MDGPPNIVVILSDEHAADAAGFAGHPQVRTPQLDRLSRSGVTFDNAYCTSPMCVPSRLSMLTGRYVHRIGAWDNEVSPSPEFPTWGDHLRPAGYRSVLDGRTHVNGDDRLVGFDGRLVDDHPDWLASSGRPVPRTADWQRGSNSHVSEVAVGPHHHTDSDRATTRAAVDFLQGRQRAAPFLLYVGYMHPHFPFVVPPDYADLYDADQVPLPTGWDTPVRMQHPVIAQLRHSFRNDEPLAADQVRAATAAYWALITHLDDQIGLLLAALENTGLTDATVVIYTSDHGEMAGRHGIWQKQCFYEPAVRVPMIIRDGRSPDGAGRRESTPVSTVDLLPTLRDLAGLPGDPELPGRSLLGPLSPVPVFAEYHAQGQLTGGFMLRSGCYKLCAYAGRSPQLFDLVDDPEELTDLAGDAAYAEVLDRLQTELAMIIDIDEVDRRARADQAERTVVARR